MRMIDVTRRGCKFFGRGALVWNFCPEMLPVTLCLDRRASGRENSRSFLPLIYYSVIFQSRLKQELLALTLWRSKTILEKENKNRVALYN